MKYLAEYREQHETGDRFLIPTRFILIFNIAG